MACKKCEDTKSPMEALKELITIQINASLHGVSNEYNFGYRAGMRNALEMLEEVEKDKNDI